MFLTDMAYDNSIHLIHFGSHVPVLYIPVPSITKATRKHNLAKTTSIKANTHVAGHAVICWKYKLES